MQRLIYVTAVICLSFWLSTTASSNMFTTAQRAIGEQSLIGYLHGKIYGALGSFLADGLRVNYVELIKKNPAMVMQLVLEEGDVPTEVERDMLAASQTVDQNASTGEAITEWGTSLDELGPLTVAMNFLIEEFNEGEMTFTETTENLLDVSKQQALRLQATIALLEGHRLLFTEFTEAISMGEDLEQAKQELVEGYEELLDSPDSIISDLDRAGIEAVLALDDYRGGIFAEAELETAGLMKNPLRALVLELHRQD